jgi:serine/threonine protein phosphatase PrpC
VADSTTPGMTASAGADLSEISWALRSHTGRVRDENEDCVGVYAPHEDDDDALRGPIFVLADGMGGHAAGEVASRLAVETVISSWTTSSTGAPHQTLRNAVRSANGTVFGASLDQDTRGMGTTLTALALAGPEGIVANVGDSRTYLVRDGECSQLTSDHSRVGEMLRAGLITPEQATHHPARSQLTRNLGHEPAVQVDITRTPISQGDVFVLCSDGLWDLVSRREIAEAVSAAPGPATEALVATALERGAPDNVSAIAVRIVGEPTAFAAKPWQRWSLFRRE